MDRCSRAPAVPGSAVPRREPLCPPPPPEPWEPGPRGGAPPCPRMRAPPTGTGACRPDGPPSPRHTHVVGPQGHAAAAARAELGAAVGAQVAAAISELGFMADSAGGRVVFVLALVTPRFFPYFPHLLLIAFKLLMQSPGQRRKWWQTK